MGCYDTVLIKCPHCERTNEKQTKSGPCSLEVIGLGSADPAMISGLTEDEKGRIFCDYCTNAFRIRMVVRPQYEVEKASWPS